MHIEISISNDVITRPLPATGPSIGALAEFTGLVRGQENGQPIGGLVYEAYQPMAGVVMRKILEELAVLFPCDSVHVHHRTGKILVAEAAIYIAVQSRHRAEAFGLLAAFMDRLKQDVPIWKTATLPA